MNHELHELHELNSCGIDFYDHALMAFGVNELLTAPFDYGYN
ncbi:hypothetical protein [Carboxylicivirga sp. RSCT41]